jgi:hypothetical protein
MAKNQMQPLTNNIPRHPIALAELVEQLITNPWFLDSNPSTTKIERKLVEKNM